MAARLACELSSASAAVASIAGGYGSLPRRPTNPVSVVEVHGTGDSVAPYNGSPPDGSAWCARGCGPGSSTTAATAPTTSRIAPRVERYDWNDCAEGAAVEHIEIFGGDDSCRKDCYDAGQTGNSATWLAWNFLREHEQAAP